MASVRTLCPFAWLAVFSALAGCAAPARVSHGDEVYVVAEFCRPRISDAQSEVLRYETFGRELADTNSLMESGRTTLGQPVYWTLLGAPKEVRYLVVGARGTPQAVLRIPSEISATEWSPWWAPDYVSTQPELARLLFQDAKSNERAAPPADAPRVRLRIMSFREFYEVDTEAHERGGARGLPGC